MNRLLRSLLLGAALCTLGCPDKDTGDTDLGTDTAEGTEVDTDTDVGTDTDTEGDTDPDTDPDTNDDCVASVTAEVSWQDCSDNVDNDCNAVFDGDELGCSICPPIGDPLRQDGETSCDDGIDNDCNGFADCADFACLGDAACPDENTNDLCSDGIDNDGNDRTDCLSRECTESPDVTVCDSDDGVENTATLCGDGLDNDGDDRVDCDDSDCDEVGYCVSFEEEELCEDGLDNDGDALIDCDDFRGCSDSPHCNGEDDDAACTDGLDNDNDGSIDCADNNCYANPAITVCTSVNEDCGNTLDDDGDGLSDCTDPECASACESEPCSPSNLFGSCSEDGFSCSTDGECVPPNPSVAGEVIVTEYMISPTQGEFIEVYNTTGGPLNLGGCTVGDLDTDNHTIADTVIVESGGYATLAKNAAEAGFVPDYVYAGGVALSGGDEARISCGEQLIDVIAWGDSDNGNDDTFPAPAGGISVALSPTVVTDADPEIANDAGSNWCIDSGTYPGGTGSPGLANTCAL